MHETKSETGSYKYSDMKQSTNGKAMKLKQAGKSKTVLEQTDSVLFDETQNDEHNVQDGSIVTNKRITSDMLRKT